MSFTGFTDQTFEFYLAIRFNNNRAFFLDNHDWYEKSVREAMLALCESLVPTIEKIDSDLETRPTRCLARINRDVRFARDKSPYRDYSFLKFRALGQGRDALPGFYFDLSDDGATFGMGLYEKNLPLMRAFGRWMTLEPDAAVRLTAPVEKMFTLYPDTIKRMALPPDLPAPLEKWYPLRAFYVERRIRDFDLIKSPALVETVVRGFQLLAPLYTRLKRLTPLDEGCGA
ncbi:MAG: DUF2461 domain-containing protein [Clostridia bacterium]